MKAWLVTLLKGWAASVLFAVWTLLVYLAGFASAYFLAIYMLSQVRP
jgi:hypothetical protein